MLAQFANTPAARIHEVIDGIADYTAHVTGEPFAAVVGWVEITVWRGLRGQSAEQVAAYLTQVNPDFVGWVLTEAAHLFARDGHGVVAQSGWLR